jgi:histidine triad (HIT) family protein
MPDYDPNCIFCKIARREIPADLVHDDGEVAAFRDINPQAPVHVLVIPARHLPSLDEARAEPALLGKLLAIAGLIAAQQGLGERGYRVVINAGQEGGQTVPHLHVHLLGGRDLTWPPG